MGEGLAIGPETSRVPEVDPPRDFRVDCDLFCLRCDYNLRGLEILGRCPECGMNVSISVSRQDLASADPRWIRRVRTSARMPRRAVVFGIPCSLVLLILSHLASFEVFKVFCFAGLIVFGPLLYGIWIFLSRPESMTVDPTASVARVIARVCILGCLCGFLMGVTCIVIPSIRDLLAATARSPGMLWGIAFVLVSPFGVLGVVGTVAFTIYFDDISKRFRTAQAGKSARSYGYLFLISSLLVNFGILLAATGSMWPGIGICIVLGIAVGLTAAGLILELPNRLIDQICTSIDESGSEKLD